MKTFNDCIEEFKQSAGLAKELGEAAGVEPVVQPAETAIEE